MTSMISVRSLSLIGIFFLNFLSAPANANDLQLASVYVDAGRNAEAISILKNYEANEEEEYRVNLLAGKIYLSIDKPAKALELFEIADVQSLDNPEAQIGIAQCYLKLGKFTLAKRYAESVRRIERDAVDPVYLLALIQARAGKFEEAVKSIEQSAQKQPDSENIAVGKAKFYALSGDANKAKDSLAEYIRRKPDSPSAYEYLGELLQKSGDQHGAIKARTKALQIFKSQSNQYRAAVMTAWLQVNDPTFRQAVENEKINSFPEKKPKTAEDVKPKPKFSEPETSVAVQRFPFPSGVMITGGSGFIVDGGKKVVTNRHVVEGGKEFAIRTGLGEVIKVKLIFTSPTDDLAVLELEKPLSPDRAIPTSSFVKPKVGRNIVVMGYPLWYMLGEGSPSLTNGVVSKRTGLKDDPSTFQITAKVNKGNSGGPVFDMKGNVVGITVGKLDAKRINEDQGFIPEDVNFAIHVDRLPGVTGISAKNEELRNELSAEELYQEMVGKVVMVATYK